MLLPRYLAGRIANVKSVIGTIRTIAVRGEGVIVSIVRVQVKL